MTDWIQLFLDIPATRWETAQEFWSEVTGCAVSVPRGEHDQFVTLLPSSGEAWLKMQAVGGAGGVHLDLDSPDPAAAVVRAHDLGATTVTEYDDVTVMRSPGGFVFCQTLLVGRPRMARTGTSVLDQVCLDIPAPLWDEEIRFWEAVTGRTVEPGAHTEFAFLGDPDPGGAIRILLQRLDEDHGPVRAHPDFAVTDRASEERRHVSAGAALMEQFDWWSVLQAPGGQVYCLTERDPSTGRVRS